MVNSILSRCPSATRLFFDVNVRYLNYPTSQNRAVRRTYVMRNTSTSTLITSLGGTVTW